LKCPDNLYKLTNNVKAEYLYILRKSIKIRQRYHIKNIITLDSIANMYIVINIKYLYPISQLLTLYQQKTI